MSKLYVSAKITVVAVERKTSKKGNSYLKVTIRDEYRNTMSLCDMNSTKEDDYEVGATGTMMLAICSTFEYTKITIEEFEPDAKNA